MVREQIRRIESVRGGLVVPTIPRPPLLSSAKTGGWHGLLLEQHMADAIYTARDSEARSHILHFFSGVPVRSEWRADGHTERVDNLPGSMMLEPRGFHFHVHVVRAQPATQWILQLDPELYFSRLFRQSMRQSPHQYVMARRIARAKLLLRTRDVGLAEIATRTGFTDQSHLSNVFRRFAGLSPTAYRSLP